MLAAPTVPAIEESGGTSFNEATKSYTQIWLGLGSPGLPVGVSCVTLVEAHPANTVTATNNANVQHFIRKFIFILRDNLSKKRRSISFITVS